LEDEKERKLDNIKELMLIPEMGIMEILTTEFIQ